MAYAVETDVGNSRTIAAKLQALLNNATITTLHASGIVDGGTDRYLCYIVYE